MYSRFNEYGVVIICLYIDDKFIWNKHRSEKIDYVRNSKFEMKDLGEADLILGFKVKKSEFGFCLNQAHYVEKNLRKFCHFNIDPWITPYGYSIPLKRNKGNPVGQSEYAKIIANIMFLMNYTRPDIAYVVS